MPTPTELDNTVHAIVTEALAIRRFDEHTSIDFKLQWPDLSTPNSPSHYEFIRDVCALSNTGYPSSFLIFGVDQAAATVVSAPWKSCNLRDTMEVVNKVRPRVDPPFEFDVRDTTFQGKTISYVHVPATHNRPHLVVKWRPGVTGEERKNVLFWREGSGIVPPSEYPDRQKLTMMFLDRPVAFSQIAIRPWIAGHRLQLTEGGLVGIPVQFCNVGNAPTSVLRVTVTGCFSDQTTSWPQFDKRDVTGFIYRGTSQSTFPLRITRGECQPVHLQVNISNEHLHAMTPHWCANRSKRFLVHVQAWDILGMEYTGDLAFDCPF